jgi:hypothetical protein
MAKIRVGKIIQTWEISSWHTSLSSLRKSVTLGLWQNSSA